MSGEEGTIYRGRIKRISNWEKLQEKVLSKIKRHTLLLILHEAKLKIFEKEENHPFPCSMYWIDIVVLTIFYCLEYQTQREVEQFYEIPHSSYSTTVSWMLTKVCLFINLISKRLMELLDRNNK